MGSVANNRITSSIFGITVLQGQRGRTGPSTSELFRSIWPVEERPEEFQNEDWVNEQTPGDMFEFKRIWDEKRRREEKGEETYRRDAPLPTKQFDGGPDNCADLLHPSRQVAMVSNGSDPDGPYNSWLNRMQRVII